MINERKAFEKLTNLDKEIDKLTKQESMDSNVVLEYKITSAESKDPTTNWYWVTLSIIPKGDFNLENIEKVVYLLHPSFSPNKIVVDTPQSGFALQFQSWGGFHAVAIIVYKNKTLSQLIRYLPIGENNPNSPQYGRQSFSSSSYD